jgi:3',5'-nucleoside bisphosphate phosphatase
VRLKDFKADLHVHTCLSPCADWEMSPRRIIRRSQDIGLDLIAVCDHNSSENAGAVMAEGRRHGICVLPGLEICSREEVHVLALFGELEQALAMQDIVHAHLPGENRPEVFGHQIVATDTDEVLAESPRLLIGATGLALEAIVRATHVLNGLSLAAHVDRPANGIIQQLGFIPADLNLDGVEVSYRLSPAVAKTALPAIGSLPCVTSSDAHRLDDIGRAYSVLRMAAPTLAEIGRALQGLQGRRLLP